MTNYKITNDWLESVEAPKGYFGQGGERIRPKYLCVYGTHWNLDDLISLFEDPMSKESAHLFVDVEGKVTQFLPFGTKAWHAGASHYQGHHGLNGFSIALYVQVPLLIKGANLEALHDTLDNLIPCIVNHYSLRDVVGLQRPHTVPFDVSPYKRYVDFGNADSFGRFVAVANVNVVSGPGVNFPKLSHLLAGDTVKVMRYSADGEWAYVVYEPKQQDNTNDRVKQGWTHESFLRRL